MREQIVGTTLWVRNFGAGRSRITVIEPTELTGYDPVRLVGCSVLLWNGTMRAELRGLYMRENSRPKRNAVFPGGIGSSADAALKLYALEPEPEPELELELELG